VRNLLSNRNGSGTLLCFWVAQRFTASITVPSRFTGWLKAIPHRSTAISSAVERPASSHSEQRLLLRDPALKFVILRQRSRSPATDSQRRAPHPFRARCERVGIFPTHSTTFCHSERAQASGESAVSERPVKRRGAPFLAAFARSGIPHAPYLHFVIPNEAQASEESAFHLFREAQRRGICIPIGTDKAR